MGRRKKMKINKEEICEDYCFFCKDGGSLRICDYKDCLKAYHPDCVGKDDSFLECEVPWTCSWHFCFNCNSTPKFHCFFCPKSICGICLCDFEFAVIGRKGGLCNHCSMLSGVIEALENPDPDQGKIDFDDPGTYEYFFKDYYEIVKQKEGLTSIHVRDAIEQLNKYRNSKDFTDLSGDEDSSQVEDEYQPTSSNDHCNDRKRHKAMKKRKRNRGNPSAIKGNVQSKKEFNGWASNLLFDFLHSIGKDTTDKLSQHDVSAIIMQYCNENKLFDTVNKKKVVCDATLKSLLGRKYVKKNSIHNLLTPHFAENVEQSENEHEQSENEHEHASEDGNENDSISFKRKRSSNSNIKPHKNEAIKLDVRRQGCFASVVTVNIRRLYLNRSLIEVLSQKPETFDDKVIGSFVRIKSDPYDYLQKNSHMLVKVTGIKRISRNDEVTKDVLLQVSCMPKDISIHLLSNDNFSEEECEDLRRRVKDGQLERPSVVEFEEKARSLHEIITKQWIVKELYRLQKLIDQANEKGWRRELHEYVERKQLLDRPSEQSRLLHEFPEIIADETEVEPADKQYSRKDEQENNLFPDPDSRELSKPSTEDSGVVADFAGHEQQYQGPESEELEQQHHTVSSHENDLLPEPDSRMFSKLSTKDSGGDDIFSGLNDVADLADHEQQNQVPEPQEPEQQDHTISSHESNDGGIHEEMINEPAVIEVKDSHPEASHSELESGQLIAAQSNSGLLEKLKNKQSDLPSEMIEISDDEEQDNTVGVNNKPVEVSDDDEQDTITIGVSKKPVDDPDSRIWYCVSPHGRKAGPYSMSLLKEHTDSFSSELKIKVWKCGQSPKEAIFLTDAIRQFSGAK